MSIEDNQSQNQDEDREWGFYFAYQIDPENESIATVPVPVDPLILCVTQMIGEILGEIDDMLSSYPEDEESLQELDKEEGN